MSQAVPPGGVLRTVTRRSSVATTSTSWTRRRRRRRRSSGARARRTRSCRGLRGGAGARRRDRPARAAGRATVECSSVGSAASSAASSGSHEVDPPFGPGHGVTIWVPRTPCRGPGGPYERMSIDEHPAPIGAAAASRVARGRREARAESAQNRVADQITTFAGSMAFVYIHIALVRGVDRLRRRGRTRSGCSR